MTKFWSTERGKVMGHGIHEFNSGAGVTNYCLKDLKKFIESKEDLNKEEILKIFNSLEAAFKKQQEAVDYIYEKIKNLEV